MRLHTVTHGKNTSHSCKLYFQDSQKKSEFGYGEVTFLGYAVGNCQVKPASTKVQSVVSYPIPGKNSYGSWHWQQQKITIESIKLILDVEQFGKNNNCDWI